MAWFPIGSRAISQVGQSVRLRLSQQGGLSNQEKVGSGGGENDREGGQGWACLGCSLWGCNRPSNTGVFFSNLVVLGSSYSTWDLVPDQGLNPGPLHWEHGVLALDHQGNPRNCVLFLFFFLREAKNNGNG